MFGRRRSKNESLSVAPKPTLSPEEILRRALLFQDLGNLAIREATSEAAATHLWVLPAYMRVAQHPHEMAKFAEVSSFFPRAVRLNPPSSPLADDILRKYLDLADNHFEALAELCGAKVTAHEWALADKQYQSPTRHPQSYLIPQGYMLTAYVASIPHAMPLGETEVATVEKGIEAYYEKAGTRRLLDLSSEQFSMNQAEDGSRTIILHDLDMRFN